MHRNLNKLSAILILTCGIGIASYANQANTAIPPDTSRIVAEQQSGKIETKKSAHKKHKLDIEQLNKAKLEELEAIIASNMANRIIAARDKVGGAFINERQLVKESKISKKVLDKLKKGL